VVGGVKNVSACRGRYRHERTLGETYELQAGLSTPGGTYTQKLEKDGARPVTPDNSTENSLRLKSPGVEIGSIRGVKNFKNWKDLLVRSAQRLNHLES